MKKDLPGVMKSKAEEAHRVVSNKYFVDEFYFGKIIDPIVEMSKGLWVHVDVSFIDKITYWLSDVVLSAGGGIRALQNGNLQQYAMYIVMGIAGCVLILFIG